MARIVIKTDQEPLQVGDALICQCGLSRSQPFCDSTHESLKEDEEETYFYSESGPQIVKEIIVQKQGCCGGHGKHGDHQGNEPAGGCGSCHCKSKTE